MYPNPSDALIHDDAVLQLWCSYNVPPSICLRMVGCCDEFLYLEKMANDCEEFGLTLEPFSVNTYESIRYRIIQLFTDSVAICIELILAVEIAPVNYEKLSIIIVTCGSPVVVLVSSPEISMAINARGPTAGKR